MFPNNNPEEPIGKIICDDPDTFYGEGRYVLRAEFKSWLDKDTELFVRPPGAGVPKWISCAERRPAKEDGYVWLLYPTGVSQFVWRWDDIGGGEETHWMPTGLKRPQPPKQEQS